MLADNTKISQKERLCDTVVLLSSLLFYTNRTWEGKHFMHTYTKDEARRIVMNCAKQYNQNLLGKSYLIIYRDRTDNQIKDIEIQFGKENYQHLTGIELIDKDGNARKHVAELFFKKCLSNTLAKDEIQFKRDGTTHLKLAALPVMMAIQKVTKIAGDYNNSRTYLVADKLIGNVNFCLGLKQIENGYVPASALLGDIKKLTTVQSQVLAIFSKKVKDEIYENVRHVSKGVNLNDVKIPDEIIHKISLESYTPKG